MTPHLKGHVRAYVDRALPPALLHLYDKHVVCCTTCRAAADQERRIVASLRADTGVPMSLRTSLMGLAAVEPTEGAPARSAPRVPVPPLGFRMPSAPSYDPVPTVRPTAPALHRSPMRAAVVASIAAGASVAAAWGLAITPVPGTRAPVVRGPIANLGVSPVGASSFGGSALPASRVTTRDPQRTNDLGTRSAYWVVTNGVVNRAPSTPGAQGLLRGTDVSSAQSGP
ncbi:anti-sigma factor [Terrabacter terrigena]|uniref:Anti-sigma factor n=1 Tax=Terrabacter terrigena TaxID=574718 RepID=A0ABW3MTD4_9MICO